MPGKMLDNLCVFQINSLNLDRIANADKATIKLHSKAYIFFADVSSDFGIYLRVAGLRITIYHDCFLF